MGGAQATSTEALPFDVIDLTPTSVVAYRPAASVDRPSVTSNLSAGGRVPVAPGDVLKVRIFEPYEGSIFPTIQRPGADLGTQRVTDDGTINVPYVGTVPVAGLDLSQIEQRIAGQLKGKAQDPAGHRRVRRRPHPYRDGVGRREEPRPRLDSRRTCARSSMPSTGGLVGPSQHCQRQPARSRGAAPWPGHPDGAIFRPARRRRHRRSRRTTRSSCGPIRAIFTVLGAVHEVGQCRDDQGQPDPARGAGQVGGLSDERANKTGVFVFRLGDIQNNPGARARVFRLDLGQPVSIFVAQQFGMQARDVVYVTNAPLYEYNKILTAIYRTFSIVGVGERQRDPGDVLLTAIGDYAGCGLETNSDGATAKIQVGCDGRGDPVRRRGARAVDRAQPPDQQRAGRDQADRRR